MADMGCKQQLHSCLQAPGGCLAYKAGSVVQAVCPAGRLLPKPHLTQRPRRGPAARPAWERARWAAQHRPHQASQHRPRRAALHRPRRALQHPPREAAQHRPRRAAQHRPRRALQHRPRRAAWHPPRRAAQNQCRQRSTSIARHRCIGLVEHCSAGLVGRRSAGVVGRRSAGLVIAMRAHRRQRRGQRAEHAHALVRHRDGIVVAVQGAQRLPRALRAPPPRRAARRGRRLRLRAHEARHSPGCGWRPRAGRGPGRMLRHGAGQSFMHARCSALRRPSTACASLALQLRAGHSRLAAQRLISSTNLGERVPPLTRRSGG